jgi:plasmid stabilization system protein ParE
VSIQTYAIRYRPRALRDFDIESIRLAEISGDEIAVEWFLKIRDSINKLSTFPHGNALTPEAKLAKHGVRVLLFRRTPSGPAWRVFYTIEEPPSGLDGFVVRVRHIRHGASPLTAFDAGDLLTDV